jgi:hypothetical protein
VTRIGLEARRRALRGEMAITRAALGVASARLRDDLKWMLIASAAIRLVPARFRWIGVLAGVAGAIGLLRARPGR